MDFAQVFKFHLKRHGFSIGPRQMPSVGKGEFMGQQLLTRTEVADLLRISLSTLDRLIIRKSIPFIRLSQDRRGRLLFDYNVIQDWLKARTMGAGENGKY